MSFYMRQIGRSPFEVTCVNFIYVWPMFALKIFLLNNRTYYGNIIPDATVPVWYDLMHNMRIGEVSSQFTDLFIGKMAEAHS